MIKIYLLDFSGADANRAYRTALPSSIHSYIDKTGNDLLKRERFFSYLLLSYAYEKEFSRALPDIERDGYSRPYFACSCIDFNISHDGEMAAAVLSDEGKVGIDIQLCQAEVSERLIKKTEKIYSEKIDCIKKKSRELEAEIAILRYSEKGEVTYCKGDIIAPLTETDFFLKWTQIEAISKADGRGVSLFSRIDFDSDRFDLKSAKITDKNEKSYALSIAHKKSILNENRFFKITKAF